MLRTISGDDIEECDNIQGVFKELENNKEKAKEYLELLAQSDHVKSGLYCEKIARGV